MSYNFLMSNSVLKVENLGKKYMIGHQQHEQYVAMRDVLTNGMRNIGRKLLQQFGYRCNAGDNGTHEEFWALRDVSFEVKQGERVGIIGRNGAGKSTLLKILSRITVPTRGRASIKGRVASLLEVGTGFHPELTGRENIFLNGAILGMSRIEIKRKFDEIVAFAEIAKFLDTPVKRYSSGMYVRLAFAVAAHLEPEILLVDEVLAVGDAQFQKKCLGKLEDVSTKEGRTVLFVSHNMSAILSLCNRAILFYDGQNVADDTPDMIIGKYLNYGVAATGVLLDTSEPALGKKLKIRKLQLICSDGCVTSEYELRNKLFLAVDFEILIVGKGFSISFELHNAQHGCIFCSSIVDVNPLEVLQKCWDVGLYQSTVALPVELLRSGNYWIKVSSAIPTVEALDVFNNELSFTLLDTSSPISKTGEGRLGSILPILEWKTILLS